MDRSTPPAVVVRAAAPHEIQIVARIHVEALPEDFLPSLGLDYLERVHYPAAFGSAFGSNLVAVTQDHLVGFVTIAHDAAAFSRDVLRRSLWTIARYAARAAWRDPRHIMRSAEVAWSVFGSPPDPVKGEIFLIAVDKAWRGQGVGRTLVRASLDYLSAKGIDACRTKTLASNAGVIHMYEQLGWTVRDRFALIGRHYVTIVSPPIAPAVKTESR
jgi:ribosomal protein S18 acetylase RimI-like enzyme